MITKCNTGEISILRSPQRLFQRFQGIRREARDQITRDNALLVLGAQKPGNGMVRIDINYLQVLRPKQGEHSEARRSG